MPTDIIATGFANLHVAQVSTVQVSTGCMLLLPDSLYLPLSLSSTLLLQHTGEVIQGQGQGRRQGGSGRNKQDRGRYSKGRAAASALGPGAGTEGRMRGDAGDEQAKGNWGQQLGWPGGLASGVLGSGKGRE